MVGVARRPPPERKRPKAALPYLEPADDAVVVVASGERRIASSALDTADLRVAGFAPGLELAGVRMAPRWEDRRAEIRDRTSAEARSYAIGDLLPHGALLVGISTGAADVMVSDAELVRLSIGAPPMPLEDLRTAFEARPLERAPDLLPEYRAAVGDAILSFHTESATTVQAYVDLLVAGGDPAVELLIGHVGDPIPMAEVDFEIPTGSGVVVRPRVTGDLVIAILERITGQTFGDPTRALRPSDRDEIASAWQRWWGIEP